ncbi:ADP-forming succinate--CoA ligase subunit beta [Deinococcus metallilatus]|uniref:Succinate--CoA ligase [ADP-forming] subunit beta n=2 Tax=Deinococcus TaxID=1298 RepID=A0AAJ5F964_9DEIO|nr:ADP-forming succinate--CoA ligase subunit beta [Deinococcus metallilatus]MBB5294087.1 succinyl-CoA synthetase beta subunit [Deinococcus metallilatus]QBY08872.1 ADP-forming succinate--CoA ligase subunit beta [Deinococcus metallilatus]RXJ10016.1 ADP-forming succinate--CoA ligase subunit beta [Deinococcus metallilatus]TLK28047.1 ADP-forming succinate--CoA ligase subunit beta [Deinococcus metallilatus]GMA16577.1 succinate--CoA ligase [ADP-forming] subunit beta [Deinococcus metallilatus]
MKLHEYQGKELLRRFGVNVQEGKVAYTPDEVRDIARDYGQPVVVKAQVHVGGRGKAGGVKFSPTLDKAYENGQNILGMDIKGLTVKKVLVTKAVDIDAGTEYYVGMIVDRNVQSYTLMASAEGGMEIEEVAAATPEKIIKYRVDPITGLRPFEAREVALQAGFKGNLNKIADMMVKMSDAALKMDAVLVEINPLFVDADGTPVALDTKFEIDDNAMYRHKDLAEWRELEAEHPLEIEASKYGFAYVKLDGNVGVLGNGAGIVMTSLDVVNRAGAKPANFLDIGGGARADIVYNAIKLVSKDPDVKSIFVNIFGGITRADEVAKGIIQALNEGILTKPVRMRVAGTAEEEAKALLAEVNSPLIQMYPDMFQAAEAAAQEANKVEAK